MPAGKDPFRTVLNDKSATVIRRGTDYAKQFDKRRGEALKNYTDLDAAQGNVLKENHPAANARVDRAAADNVAAADLGESLRDKARTKYAKGGSVK